MIYQQYFVNVNIFHTITFETLEPIPSGILLVSYEIMNTFIDYKIIL